MKNQKKRRKKKFQDFVFVVLVFALGLRSPEYHFIRRMFSEETVNCAAMNNELSSFLK